MDFSNMNVKYVVGNIVILIVAVWWASVLFKYTGNIAEYIQVTLIVCVQCALMMMGWRYFIIKPEELEKKKLVCTVPVSAMLINYVPANALSAMASSSGDNKYTKYAVYEFEWEGHVMTATADLMYTGTVKKGIPSEILVNPKNPNEIYEPQIERSRQMRYRVNGTLYIIAGFASFFYGF